MARRSLISKELPTTARARPRRRPRRRRWVLFVVLFALLMGVGAALSAPSIVRWYLRNNVIPKVSRLLKCNIEVGAIKVGWGDAELQRIVVSSANDGDKPLFQARLVQAHFRVRPLIGGRVVVDTIDVLEARIHIVRHADGRDNLRDLFRPQKLGGPPKQRKLEISRIDLHSARLTVLDNQRHGELRTLRVDALLVPGSESRITFHNVEFKAKALPSRVTWKRIEVIGRLGRRMSGPLPRISLSGGQFRILPKLELSGIRGTIAPKAGGSRFDVDIQGSYAGAETTLWSAKGWVEPFAMKGELLAKATRFELARIAKYFKQTPVIHPERTAIEGYLKLQLQANQVQFDGQLGIARLSIFHPGLARAAIEDLSARVTLSGKIESNSDLALDLRNLTINYQGVDAKLSGRVDNLLTKPIIDLRLEIPTVPCQRVLEALPRALTPRLQGFRVKGNFRADLHTHIDYSNLAKLKLGGKMPVNRCRVTYAPPGMSAERLLAPFDHEVEDAPGRDLSFLLGPENEYFALYSEIPAHVVNAFLTTEDGGFFRHKGFIVSQFRTALARNLGQGGFRLGASTISMQMVKNVLLTHEKTLSRKLQELFLVWYLERILTKERIMEIYLNAIEFGPGIYGIGRAAEHYFGKQVGEITPLEAAFFAMMLPSPKRRYVQYCEGQLKPKWKRKMQRVLKRMVRYNRLTTEEYAPFSDAPLVFKRDFEAESADACIQRVEDLLDAWEDEHYRRLRVLIERYAPHQAELYLHRPAPTKSKRGRHQRAH